MNLRQIIARGVPTGQETINWSLRVTGMQEFVFVKRYSLLSLATWCSQNTKRDEVIMLPTQNRGIKRSYCPSICPSVCSSHASILKWCVLELWLL